MTELPKLKEFEELAEDHMDLFRQHQEKQNQDGKATPEVGEKEEVLGGDESGEEVSQESQATTSELPTTTDEELPTDEQ